MTVLVTGGAGYIGSHLVLALLDRGETPVVLDNLSTGFAWAVPAGVPLVTGDMGDADLVARTIADHGIREIVHFAAKIVVPDSVADPLGYYLNNTSKSRTLIETAIRGGVDRMIFSSTAAVYGDVSGDPVDETAPTAPVSPYGRSKLMTEWMLADAGVAHGLRSVALRYFNVAGADPAGRSGQSMQAATHLIKVAAQAVLGQRPKLDVFGTDYPTRDGSCLRDYIHVSDLADAHLAALDHLRGGGGSLTLNCGYGQGTSVLEVIEVMKRVSGVDFPVAISPRRPGDPAAIVAKADRIRSELGWSPKRDDLDGIVRSALAWERHLLTAKAA
ncbi:UDP-glucose 4-epimerase GalE [Enterovirga rhinocerotis]|uniref:UDP-glucose 4-epimerase n=1 Tax=Enterovirga rhinocerotis TaxID=1339210 RepID=A0A4R7C8T9_9HYPH|nr:UDP-glucose 4-epimerase GalE [Enterovirga rhinocerotis]TDR94683.1 UDP-glucose 4-epimerase [Enterovirga rhinocerotis]